jgi:hypothetical protein
MIENLKGLCYKNEFDPESGYNNLDHQPSSPVMYHSDYGYSTVHRRGILPHGCPGTRLGTPFLPVVLS